jgi:uncharacterized membrane protein YeaQ/YmgE (transglycosylase-associated protein family)
VSILAWIILGLISGFLASKIVNKTGEGFLLDIVLGIVGSVVGCWLFHKFGKTGRPGQMPVFGLTRVCNKSAICSTRSLGSASLHSLK